MPTFQFEAMDPQGQEIRDVIDAQTQDEAQATIRSMGYFVTKISVQKTDKKNILFGEKNFVSGFGAMSHPANGGRTRKSPIASAEAGLHAQRSFSKRWIRGALV